MISVPRYDQYRICFHWEHGYADDVEVTYCHSHDDRRVVMAKKTSRSRGIRPVRNASLCALMLVGGVLLVVKGVADMRASGRSGSPYLMLGLFPALLSPIGLGYYLLKIPVVRSLRRGTTAIARWTVSPDEFRQFCEADARVAAETRTNNFYEPPSTVPAEGVEVIFSDDGVLIGDGYFPLSTTGGRRVHRVRLLASGSPMIEFGTMLETRVRTSSVTTQAVRTAETLRVPVTNDARVHAEEVVRRFNDAVARR